MKVNLKGYGRAVPQISVVCASGNAGVDKELVQWTPGGTATTGEKTLTRSSTAMQLWGNRIEQISWQEILPCVPRSVRLVLQSSMQPLVTLEEFLQEPERQRAGFIDIHRIEANLVGGNDPSNAIVIPLKTRPIFADFAPATMFAQ